MPSRRPEAVPAPVVEFPAGFAGRLGALARAFVARRGRLEGPGAAGPAEGGLEVVGWRPYRPGDDPRLLDPDLLARLDRPYTRVLRRERAERWSIVVDASGSMVAGEGRTKLQCAAEVAAALAAAGLHAGARVGLRIAGGERRDAGPAPSSGRFQRTIALRSVLAMLAGVAPAGDAGLAQAILPALAGRADRVFLIGDFLDVPPERLGAAAARGSVSLVQVLAPCEMEPERVGDRARWFDPETGDELEMRLDGESLPAYRRALRARLRGLAAVAARHGMRLDTWSSGTPLEAIARAALGEAR